MSPIKTLKLAANLLKIQRTQEHAEFSKTRSLFFKEVCRSGYYNCRMKCNADEFAIRYCADWSICCRLKKTELKKKKMW
nr:beta-defensin 43-like [Equus caballus]